MSPRRRRAAHPDELDRPVDIQLRAFPSEDPNFYGYACAALDGIRRPSIGALQEAIRTRYPLAVVRAQDDLARRGGGQLVWYAFRYGAVVHGPPAMAAIDWDAPGVAWAILDDERRVTDADRAFAAIVELPHAEIVGRAVEELTASTDPSAGDDLAALWRQFVDTRWVESMIRFTRKDGTRGLLACRIVADDPEPGRHRLRIVEIAGS